MANKLYVGGLAWATDSEGLKAAFAEYGTVDEAIVISDRETGRSRGFGFVTFADDESAKAALALNGSQLDGRTIRVDVAAEKRSSDGPRGGGGGGRGRY